MLLVSLLLFCCIRPSYGKETADSSLFLNTIPSYLASPTGTYHVGYVDYHWINNKACPNLFHNIVSKEDFSKSNSLFCNEVWVRIYYPTNEIGSSDYLPVIQLKETISEYNKSSSIQLDQLQSFSKKDAKLANGKYPVIFFASGYGVSPQMYENILTSLVSYGYIVVAINSEFLNGPIKLKNNRQVNSYLPKNKQQAKDLFVINLQDMAFIYEQIKNGRIEPSLFNAIDFKHVGLLGHSLGAGTVAHFSERQNVQAVATMDLAWDNIYINSCKRDFSAPFLELFSSQIYYANKSKDLPYLCRNVILRKNKYVIVLLNKLIPQQKDYTVHMSFSDQSTLQYQSDMYKVIQIANRNINKPYSGLGNGWDINNTVNTQLLIFFERYLKMGDTEKK
ncbi:MAG: hypothetical protein K0R24_1693 [Gammaproteobacteria bacterium]|nr:hypothetical protein [Gammaproteobacteria bacterium]